VILSGRGGAQIFPSKIAIVSVCDVDPVAWPVPCHVQISKPRRAILALIECDYRSVRREGPDRLPDAATAASYATNKHSRRWVIMQNRAQTFGGQWLGSNVRGVVITPSHIPAPTRQR
jgi:hypothetical protein